MFWFASFIGLMAAGGLFYFGSEDVFEDAEDDSGSEDTDQPDPPPQSLADFIFGGAGNGSADVSLPSETGSTGETTSGSDSDDILSGSSDNDSLSGGSGDDQINGYGGADSLSGDTGNDQLFGAEGNDTLTGGEGADTLHGETDNDRIEGGEGNDLGFGHFGTDTLNGGSGDDTLHGGQDADILLGCDGEDALHGNDDNDTILGGDGKDTLFGGHGSDLLSGADDQTGDYINGGKGDDRLIAGEGDTVTGGDGADTILLGDWITQGTVELVDFDPTQDQLLLIYDAEENPPNLTIEEDPQTPGEYVLSLDGEEAMRLTAGDELTPADVELIPATEALLNLLPIAAP